jgi:hypothetical protein
MHSRDIISKGRSPERMQSPSKSEAFLIKEQTSHQQIELKI